MADDEAVTAIAGIYADGTRLVGRSPVKMHWDSVVLQLAVLRELRAIREMLEVHAVRERERAR